MRVSFSIKEPNQLKSFFNIDAPYLDFIITRDFVYICTFRTGIYSHKQLPVLTRENFTNLVNFRMPKDLFIGMLNEAVVTIEFNELDEVIMSFEPKEKAKFVISLTHQQSDLKILLQYLDIVELKDRYSSLDLTPLKNKLSLLRVHDGVVTVKDNTIKMTSDDVDTYLKVKVPDMAIQTKFLKYILDNSDYTYKYSEVLIGTSEDSVIIASQAIPESTNDFSFVQRARTKDRFTVDFGPISVIVAKAPKDISTIKIDFLRKKAFLNGDYCKISTDFFCEEESKPDLTDEELMKLLTSPQETEERKVRFEFPIKFFKDFMSKSTVNLTVEVKNQFVLLYNNYDTYFVMGRRSF